MVSFTPITEPTFMYPDAHLLPWERKIIAQYRYDQSNKMMATTFEIGTFEFDKDGRLLRFIPPTNEQE